MPIPATNAAPMMPPTTAQLSLDVPGGKFDVAVGEATTAALAPTVGVGITVVGGLFVAAGLDVAADVGFGVDVAVITGTVVVVIVELPIITFPLLTVIPVSVTPVWLAISAPVRVIDDCPLAPALAVML